MREFKFRGKHNGEWVYGYVYEHEPPLQRIVPEYYVPEKSKWYIAKTAFADWNMLRGIEYTEILPESISQYTNKTINEKELYANDYIGFYYTNAKNVKKYAGIAQVVWNDEYLGWGLKWIKGSRDNVSKLCCVEFADYDMLLGYLLEWFDCQRGYSTGYEIIDNPELLEVEE